MRLAFFGIFLFLAGAHYEQGLVMLAGIVLAGAGPSLARRGKPGNNSGG
jgi:hypothetical protein